MDLWQGLFFDLAEDGFALVFIHDIKENLPETRNGFRPSFLVGFSHALTLRLEQFFLERLALVSQIKEPLAPVFNACNLVHIAFLNKLPQNAGQALLGDPEQAQEAGDGRTRIAADKIEHTVVRTAEARISQDIVRVAGKVAIGEIQKLNAAPELFFP